MISWRLTHPSTAKNLWKLRNNADDSIGVVNGTWDTLESYADGPYGHTVGNFDGTNYIDSGLKLDIDQESFTVCYFLNLSTDASRGGMFQRKEGGTYQGMLLGKNENANINARVMDTSGTDLTVSVAQSLGSWIHYLMTYDHTNKTLILYVDGKRVGSDTDGTFTGVMTTSEHQNLQFMGRKNGSGLVIGKAAMYRFFPCVLTGDEVKQLHNLDRII